MRILILQNSLVYPTIFRHLQLMIWNQNTMMIFTMCHFSTRGSLENTITGILSIIVDRRRLIVSSIAYQRSMIQISSAKTKGVHGLNKSCGHARTCTGNGTKATLALFNNHATIRLEHFCSKTQMSLQQSFFSTAVILIKCMIESFVPFKIPR